MSLGRCGSFLLLAVLERAVLILVCQLRQRQLTLLQLGALQ